jgi:hypothetical protein
MPRLAVLSRPLGWDVSALVLLAAVFAVLCAVFIRRTTFQAVDGQWYHTLVDDALISMRYGWNLVNGNGLVWNAGERVEGYTNPLMVLCMAFFILLFGKLSACMAVQVLGALTLLCVAWAGSLLSSELCAEHRMRRLISVMTFALVPAYGPLAYWSLLGMECGLAALWVVIGTCLVVTHEQTSGARRRAVLTGCAWALAYLTRPDALLPGVAVGTVMLVQGVRLRSNIRPLLLSAAVVAGVVVAHTALRLWYYGELLPNTYVLKVEGVPLAHRVVDGWRYVGPYLLSHLVLMGLALTAVLRAPSAPRTALLVGWVTSLAYQISVGGDFGAPWRLPLPAVPFLLVLAAIGAADLVVAASGPGRRGSGNTPGDTLTPRGMLAWHCLLLPLFGLLLTYDGVTRDKLFSGVPPTAIDMRYDVHLAVAIRRLTDEDATVAVTRAGAIPYFSERPAIDMLGKCDAHVARLPPDLSGSVSWERMKSVPGHNKYDLVYSLVGKQPCYIETCRWGRDDVCEWARQRYSEVVVGGCRLMLLGGSRHVRWGLVGQGPNPYQPRR